MLRSTFGFILFFASFGHAAEYYPIPDSSTLQGLTTECRFEMLEDVLVGPAREGSKYWLGQSVQKDKVTGRPALDLINRGTRQVRLPKGAVLDVEAVVADQSVTTIDSHTSRLIPKQVFSDVRVTKIYLRRADQRFVAYAMMLLWHSDIVPLGKITPLSARFGAIRPWIGFDVTCLTDR